MDRTGDYFPLKSVTNKVRLIGFSDIFTKALENWKIRGSYFNVLHNHNQEEEERHLHVLSQFALSSFNDMPRNFNRQRPVDCYPSQHRNAANVWAFHIVVKRMNFFLLEKVSSAKFCREILL
jgi:hypothetical protein